MTFNLFFVFPPSYIYKVDFFLLGSDNGFYHLLLVFTNSSSLLFPFFPFFSLAPLHICFYQTISIYFKKGLEEIWDKHMFVFSSLGVQSWAFTKQKSDHVTDCSDSAEDADSRCPDSGHQLLWLWLCCRETAALSAWGELRTLLTSLNFGLHCHVLLCAAKIFIHATETTPDLTFGVVLVPANSDVQKEPDSPVSPPRSLPLPPCCSAMSVCVTRVYHWQASSDP